MSVQVHAGIASKVKAMKKAVKGTETYVAAHHPASGAKMHSQPHSDTVKISHGKK